MTSRWWMGQSITQSTLMRTTLMYLVKGWGADYTLVSSKKLLHRIFKYACGLKRKYDALVFRKLFLVITKS